MRESSQTPPAAAASAAAPAAAEVQAERYESPERFGIIMQRESLVDIFTACAPPTATMIPLAAAAIPIKVPPHEEGGGGGEGWRHGDIGGRNPRKLLRLLKRRKRTPA